MLNTSPQLTMKHPSKVLRHQTSSFARHKIQLSIPKATPDPKHHGQAMRSSMRTEWIKSQNLEMQGIWGGGVCQKVLRTSLCPQDRCPLLL